MFYKSDINQTIFNQENVYEIEIKIILIENNSKTEIIRILTCQIKRKFNPMDDYRSFKYDHRLFIP